MIVIKALSPERPTPTDATESATVEFTGREALSLLGPDLRIILFSAYLRAVPPRGAIFSSSTQSNAARGRGVSGRAGRGADRAPPAFFKFTSEPPDHRGGGRHTECPSD